MRYGGRAHEHLIGGLILLAAFALLTFLRRC
jgi:hypothetical protein